MKILSAFLLISLTISYRTHRTPRRMMDTLTTATAVDPTKEPRERVYDSIDVLHFLGHTLERMTHDTYDVVRRMKRSTKVL